MKFWERLLNPIFKIVAEGTLRKFRRNSIENILRKSLCMIEPQIVVQIKDFVTDKQTPSGGFADKGGDCDLYYSLFGCYLAEALDMQEVFPGLKRYIEYVVQKEIPEGVYLHSTAILYSKLFGSKNLPVPFRNNVHEDILNPVNLQPAYSGFLSLMTLYYLEDYYGLYRVQNKLGNIHSLHEMPCPVMAAQIVLRHSSGKPVQDLEKSLNKFYRNGGNFAATVRAPIGDLLSTAVALYAMKFTDADTRIIKPDCLSFIDSLYSGGGFCATSLDADPDVEYTFYGLLALGALSE
jgi:hypothetical protein